MVFSEEFMKLFSNNQGEFSHPIFNLDLSHPPGKVSDWPNQAKHSKAKLIR